MHHVVPICWSVDAYEKPRVGAIVRRGVNGVINCTPNPCIVAKHTEVRVRGRGGVRFQEVDGGVVVWLNEVPLIYDKETFDYVRKAYIEPLSRGEEPLSKALLIIGPPGTGKSSLVKVIAEATGLYVVRVEPWNVLSKWVGEAENKLMSQIDDAFSNQPSIVIMDDADWLMQYQRGAAARGEDSMVSHNLVTIMFRRMDEAIEGDARVLFVATTNVGFMSIDTALQRRFRKPLVVKPVTVELARLWVREASRVWGWVREYEDWVVREVARGVPMSQIVHALREARALGIEPRTTPLSTQGYYYAAPRIVEDAVVELPLGKVEVQPALPPRINQKVWRLTEPLNEAVAYLALSRRGFLAMKVVDRSRLWDAAVIAEHSRAGLVVGFTLRDDELKFLLSRDLVIYFTRPPIEEGPRLPVIYYEVSKGINVNTQLFKAALAYYGVRCENLDLTTSTMGVIMVYVAAHAPGTCREVMQRAKDFALQQGID